MRTISNSLLENLLLSLQEDGTYKTYIVSYDLSEQEQEDISNGIQINLKNRATFTEIDVKNLTSDIFRNKMDACGYNSEVICWEVACEIDGCWDSQYTTTECDTILIYVDCSDGGGGGSGTDIGEEGNTSGNTGSGGHGGGRNGSGTSNSDVTTPTIPQPWEEVSLCLSQLSMSGSSNGFTPEMSVWLQSQPKSVVGQINNYIDQNECSETAQDFTIQAITALMDGGEVDWEDQLIVDPTFKSNQKAKCIYDKMKNLNSSIFSNILSAFDNSTTVQLRLTVENIPQLNSSIYRNALTLPKFGGGNLSSTKIVLDSQFVQDASTIEIALTLVHEMAHAEIMERCIRLGIITAINYNSNYEVSLNFSGNQVITNNIPDILFATLIDSYTSYSNPNVNANPNWQHDIFGSRNYRTRISQNLEEVHPWLDDSNNPFENNLNNGTVIDMTLSEFFELISWLGLEETTEYNNLSPLELTKITQAKNQMDSFYNSNCN